MENRRSEIAPTSTVPDSDPPGRPDELGFLSADEHVRLAAARALTRHPDPSAISELERALARESVSWVRLAIKSALETCVSVNESPSQLNADADLDADQAYADGRRDGLRQALHEIAPIVGLARLANHRGGETSEVSRHLDSLRQVCDALRRLVDASAPAYVEDFDLAGALREVVHSSPHASLTTLSGPAPFVVTGDSDLLRICVAPLLANAAEAVLLTHEKPSRGSVLLTWGAEGSSYWVAVIDRGPGPPRTRGIFDVGSSSKEGHFGLGLATAVAAARSLGADLSIERNSHGGATAIVTWSGEPGA